MSVGGREIEAEVVRPMSPGRAPLGRLSPEVLPNGQPRPGSTRQPMGQRRVPRPFSAAAARLQPQPPASPRARPARLGSAR